VEIVELLQAEAAVVDLETLGQKCAPALVQKIEVASGEKEAAAEEGIN
jgi:hypothetical protein